MTHRTAGTTEQVRRTAPPIASRPWLELAAVALAYLLLTLAATWPLTRHFGALPAGGGDSGQNVWNLWWFAKAILSGETPYRTDMLYYPDGVSLAYHTLSPLNGLLALPLLSLFNASLPAAFNSALLFSFVLTGAGMYALTRQLVGNRAAAFVAGIIFVFAPYRMSRVYFGNLGLYSTAFIPLAVLFAVQLRRTLRWRYGVAVAVTFALTVWGSLQLGLGLALLLGLLLITDLLAVEKKGVLLGRWLLIGGLSALLVAPVVAPMVRDRGQFQAEGNQRAASIANSADLLGFIIPDRATAPWVVRAAPDEVGRRIAEIYDTFQGNPSEKSAFVGYVVLALVMAGALLTRDREPRRWLIIAACFGLLALGPVLHVGGRVWFQPMPYELFLHVPLLKVGRSPSRFALYAIFSLSIVAGYGLAQIQRRWHWGTVLVALLGGLILVEFLIAPVRVDRRFSTIPAFYHQIAGEAGGPILDVPIDLHGAQGPAESYMIYQTVHGRPIVGGYISRTPRTVFDLFEQPFLNQLRARLYNDQAPYDFSAISPDAAQAELRALGVEYVILHTDALSPADAATVRGALEAALGRPIHEDVGLVVWSVE